MAAWLDDCGFIPTAGGTADWTFSSAIDGSYLTPVAANAVNGLTYKVIAVSSDKTQMEVSEGACTITGGIPTFARTTILYNSSGTGTKTPGQSGAGTKINFTTVPHVQIIAVKEDLISVEEANSFTAAQQSQARQNIGMTDGQLPATGTNDNAASGKIGEYTSATLGYASRITLSSGVAANVTSIVLSPGDWDLTGFVNFETTGSPLATYARCDLSITSAAITTVEGNYAYGPPYNANVTDITGAVPSARFSVSSNVTVYLVATSAWTGGSSPTVKAWGILSARRRR